MAGKQKLELTWFGKEKRPHLEPRILLEDPGNSYHAPHPRCCSELAEIPKSVTNG